MTFEGRVIVAPAGPQTDEFLVRPLVTSDAELDYQAVMETKEFLRRWERSTWPEDDFTVEANLADMVKMQERHERGESFGYTVQNLDQTECFGCVYIFSTDARWYQGAEATAIGDGDWNDHDAMVHYWVRASQMQQGLDARLLQELVPWIQQQWGFAAPVFITNETLDEQVEALDATGLTRRFVISHAEHDANDFAYG